MNAKDFVFGELVTYIPNHAKGDENHPDREIGVVSSTNENFVFVKYSGKQTAQATSPGNLEKGDHTFYCPDEHVSYLNSAFGRCSKQCFNCSEKALFMERNFRE